jgi:hypothetical protein
MLLAAAERRIGIARTLAPLVADPRDPALVRHGVDDILRARMLAIACCYESLPSGRRSRTRRMPTISITYVAIPASSWPAGAYPTAAEICARSQPCRAGRMRQRCARWCA